MRNSVLATFAIVATLGLVAPAAAASFNNVILSSTKDATTSESNFPANTPKLYVSADLVDADPTSKVTFTWISVDSHGVAPANYTIDSADVTVGSYNSVNSDLSEPTAGWPLGTYRVDLAIDGKVLSTADFSIP